MAMITTDYANSRLQINGDISSEFGQLGDTVFLNAASGNYTQDVTFSNNYYYRYLIEATGPTIFTLAKINNPIVPGYSCLIKNTGTSTLTINENSGTLITTIDPDLIYLLSAKTDGIPDIWIFSPHVTIPGSTLNYKACFIDAIYGNDGTGVVDRFDKPFATLNAAHVAAGNNTTALMIVRPNDANELIAPTTPYIFNLTTLNGAIRYWYFYDRTYISVPSTVTYYNTTILGRGIFVLENNIDMFFTNLTVISLYHIFECYRISGSGTSQLEFTNDPANPSIYYFNVNNYDVPILRLNSRVNSYGIINNITTALIYGNGTNSTLTYSVLNIDKFIGNITMQTGDIYMNITHYIKHYIPDVFLEASSFWLRLNNFNNINYTLLSNYIDNTNILGFAFSNNGGSCNIYTNTITNFAINTITCNIDLDLNVNLFYNILTMPNVNTSGGDYININKTDISKLNINTKINYINTENIILAAFNFYNIQVCTNADTIFISTCINYINTRFNLCEIAIGVITEQFIIFKINYFDMNDTLSSIIVNNGVCKLIGIINYIDNNSQVTLFQGTPINSTLIFHCNNFKYTGLLQYPIGVLPQRRIVNINSILSETGFCQNSIVSTLSIITFVKAQVRNIFLSNFSNTFIRGNHLLNRNDDGGNSVYLIDNLQGTLTAPSYVNINRVTFLEFIGLFNTTSPNQYIDFNIDECRSNIFNIGIMFNIATAPTLNNIISIKGRYISRSGTSNIINYTGAAINNLLRFKNTTLITTPPTSPITTVNAITIEAHGDLLTTVAVPGLVTVIGSANIVNAFT